MPRRIAIVLAVIVAPLLVQACSLPPDERVTRIDANELGPELVNPTTTTTTTVPPTTVPTTTDPSVSAPETTTTTSTTIEVAVTELQRVAYTLGSSDTLDRIGLQLRSPVSYIAIRQELVSPRPEVRALGLATAVPAGLVSAFTFDEATVTLTISLDAETFGALTESRRRRAIGQLVLTYTSFAPLDSGAIGFVNFAIDGAPINVFVPRTGGSSEDGQPLTFADFAPLLGDATGAPDETTPPTPPATTAPPATPN
jgi:hypothetical protein